MPITIDITQHIRFNAGEKKGKAQVAENMIIKGFPLLLVQEITGLQMDVLISISNKITKEK